MMKRLVQLRSERGSVLIQVLLASALAVIVVLTLSQLTVMMHRFVSHAQTKLSLFEIRNNLLSTILSETAWTNTLANDENKVDAQKYICLSGTNGDIPPAIDCSGMSENLTLVDGGKEILVFKAGVTMGFSRTGKACDTFDEVNGNPSCPIHVDARWETECVSPCNMRAPPLKISVSFKYVDPDKVSSINTEQLNFVIRR